MILLHTAAITAHVRRALPGEEERKRLGAARWLRALGETGAAALLLDAGIEAAWWPGVEPALAPPGGSLLAHAMRPPAFAYPGGPRLAGEAPALADPDPEARAAAVKEHLRLLSLADRWGCRLWLLRPGRAEMEDPIPELEDLHARERLPESEEGQERARAILAGRARRAAPLADPFRRSLDRLLPEAERAGAVLCLENARGPRAWPNCTEAASLLAEFAGAPLGFWLDAGHLEVHAQLGLAERGAALGLLAPALRGATLHDAEGVHDHLPPGEGRADFAWWRENLPPGLPLAIDVRRARRGGVPSREAADRAAWEEDREARGHGGLSGGKGEEAERFTEAEPQMIKEVLEGLGGWGVLSRHSERSEESRF